MDVQLFSPDRTHLHHLIQVEREAWQVDGENAAASRDKITARLGSFPDGITLAMINGAAAGSQYAFQFDWDGQLETLTSWDDLTADGWTDRVHCANGNTGFLVGVGVVPAFRGALVNHHLRWPGQFKVSELLIARTLDNLFAHGVEQVVGNARVPAYHLRPDLGVHTYCQLRRDDGTHFDPVLRFHVRMGARILKPVEYAMEDPESRNAGCWVVYTRRFTG